jgi:molecular chaperone GrpE
MNAEWWMSGYDERRFQRTRRPDVNRRGFVRPGPPGPLADTPPRAGEPTAEDGPAVAEEGGTEEQPDLEAVTAERDRYFDQLQRTAAEYANYRRRTENERAQMRLAANETLLRDIVPVLDDLQRGLSALPPDEQDSSLAAGIRAVEQKFLTALRKHGVTPIDALGQPFDPSQHEAVEMDPAGGTDVVAVYAPGYRLGEGILRPAMVKVGTESRSREGEESGSRG